MFKKSVSLLLVFSLLIMTLMFSACTPSGQVKMDKVVTYMYIGSSCYNLVAQTVYPMLPPEKAVKVCEVHTKIQSSWNLAVKALQVYYENQGAHGSEAVQVNLASFKEAVAELIKLLNVSEQNKIYIDAGLSSVTLVMSLVLNGKVTFTEGEKYDLSDMMIGDCPLPPQSFDGVPTNRVMSSRIGELKGTLKNKVILLIDDDKTPELKALDLELNK